MNAKQNSFFQMLAAVAVVTDGFEPDWKATPSFAVPYRQLRRAVLDRLPDALARQGADSTGITAGKKALREALEAHLQSLAAAVEAYAITVADKPLAAAAHLTKSDARLATDDALLGLERRVVQLAGGHLKALAPYGVTRARIATLDADAAAFADAVGAPRAAIAAKREGTGALDTLGELARDYLEAMDAQMVLFEAAAPSFHSQYFTARKLMPPARRPRALFIGARDADGDALAGVVVRIDGLDLTKVTSARGACYVDNAAPGSYPVLATKHGYQPLTTIAHLNAGETTHLDLVLTPVAD